MRSSGLGWLVRGGLAASLWFACAGHLGCHEEGTTLTSYRCPQEGTELTFENFGRPFVDDYCQRCHASGAAHRNGAPRGFAFDTLDAIAEHRGRVFARAAADNTSMPPGPDGPGAVERDLFAEWLACSDEWD